MSVGADRFGACAGHVGFADTDARAGVAGAVMGLWTGVGAGHCVGE